MAFDNEVRVILYDRNDKIIMPVTVPISITYNLQAFDFDYVAVQVDTYDTIMRKVLQRWSNKELIQYSIEGRFGKSTGDLNSIYAYDSGSGEFTFYGRSHKSILNDVVGFIDPSLNAVSRRYPAEHKVYTGSALKVMRDVLTDNVVKRLEVPMTFQSGNLGNNVTIDFRFDELHAHFYTDSKDKGGAQLAENGNIIFDIVRDFKAHKFVLTAREPVHHDRIIEMRTGLLERWQITMDRGEANRIIVGGPREGVDRIFGSTEADPSAPKNDTLARSEKAQIEANIAALGRVKASDTAAARKASNGRKATLKSTQSKAYKDADKVYKKRLGEIDAEYKKDLADAKKDYDAAMAKAKTDAEKKSAKSSYDSDVKSAKNSKKYSTESAESTRKSARERADDTYKEDLGEENKTLAAAIRAVNTEYKVDVAGQRQLLTTLLKEWPYPHRRFPAEMYTENTSPDGIESGKLNPSSAQEQADTIEEIAKVLNKYAVSKMAENGPSSDVSGELVESDHFYLGKHLALGDYVKIGIDENTLLGEQQIEKVIITWSNENGYKVQLSKPDDTDSTEADVLKRVLAAVKDLSTKTRRR